MADRLQAADGDLPVAVPAERLQGLGHRVLRVLQRPDRRPGVRRQARVRREADPVHGQRRLGRGRGAEGLRDALRKRHPRTRRRLRLLRLHRGGGESGRGAGEQDQ